jgi:hypothetical protein
VAVGSSARVVRRAAKAPFAEWAQGRKGHLQWFCLGVLFAAALVCCRFESTGDAHGKQLPRLGQLNGIDRELKGMTAASVRFVPENWDPRPQRRGLIGIVDSVDDWIDEHVLVSWKTKWLSQHFIPPASEDYFKPHVARLTFFDLLVLSGAAVSVWLIKRFFCRHGVVRSSAKETGHN